MAFFFAGRSSGFLIVSLVHHVGEAQIEAFAKFRNGGFFNRQQYVRHGTVDHFADEFFVRMGFDEGADDEFECKQLAVKVGDVFVLHDVSLLNRDVVI